MAREKLVSFWFVASSEASTLSLTSLPAGGSFGALIDNVQVTPVAEPSTWLLILGGGLGAAWRRRLQKG